MFFLLPGPAGNIVITELWKTQFVFPECSGLHHYRLHLRNVKAWILQLDGLTGNGIRELPPPSVMLWELHHTWYCLQGLHGILRCSLSAERIRIQIRIQTVVVGFLFVCCCFKRLQHRHREYAKYDWYDVIIIIFLRAPLVFTVFLFYSYVHDTLYI